jgi:hypothetical protein
VPLQVADKPASPRCFLHPAQKIDDRAIREMMGDETADDEVYSRRRSVSKDIRHLEVNPVPLIRCRPSNAYRLRVDIETAESD